MKIIIKIIVLAFAINFTINLFGNEKKQIYLPISVDFQDVKASKMAISYSKINESTIKQGTILYLFYNSYEIIRKALEENNPIIVKDFMLYDKNFNNKAFHNNFDADINYVNKMKKNGLITTYQIIGNEEYCIFIWGTKNNLLLITFLYSANGAYILSNTPSYSALLLLEIYRQGNIKYVENNTKFKYDILLKDNSGYNILTLSFNGEFFNKMNDPNNNTKTIKKIANFYNELQTTLKENNNPERYASFFTIGSKERILKEYQVNRRQFEAYRKYQIDNVKNLKFVIFAEPFYIIFYTFANSPNDFFYEYLLETDSGLKITNTGFVSDFDLLISSNLDIIKKGLKINE